MTIPICQCGERECEKFGGHAKGYRKVCWKCRQFNPNPDLYRKRKRDNVALLKQKAINGYGGMCQCCGEKEISFLSIDHVNNDGAAHRKDRGKNTGVFMYRLVIKNEFPKEYQVLCFNCNIGKHLNGGVCPHKLK